MDLDVLAAVSEGREDWDLALSEDDKRTLRDLVKRGMGPNSLRALSSDALYLEAWCLASTGSPLPCPAPEALVMKFVAQHLAPAGSNGMPMDVEQALRGAGRLRKAPPHSPATVRRRLSSWATLHAWKAEDGPFQNPALKKTLRLAVRASPHRAQKKSQEALTLDVLAPVLELLEHEAQDDGLVGLRAVRDRALIGFGFSAGGRRRSEIAALVWEDVELIKQDGEEVLRIAMGRTKTTASEDGISVYVRGRVTSYLAEWRERSKYSSGPVFRSVNRWGQVSSKGMSPGGVNEALKGALARSGLDTSRFSAHGLRSGFLTEAFLQGLSVPEAMAQSLHKSPAQAVAYFRAAEARSGRAAHLFG